MEITDGRRGDGREERNPHADAADAAFSAIPCASGQEASVRTIREVSTYLIELGQIPLAKIPKMLADVDVNGDGMISLDEWRNSFAELGLGGGDAMQNLEPNIVAVPLVPSLPLSAASYIVVKESTGPIGLSLAERQPNPDRLQASNNHPITIVEVKPNTPAARSVPPLAAGMRIVGINGIPVPADVHTAAERISQLGRGKMTLEVLPGATPAERRSWISR
jgi:PDZ domain